MGALRVPRDLGNSRPAPGTDRRILRSSAIARSGRARAPIRTVGAGVPLPCTRAGCCSRQLDPRLHEAESSATACSK